MSSGERQVLIVLEIVDVSGKGIDSTDSGVPRFTDANRNVELFVSHLIRNDTYVNPLNQTVIQLVSEVPVEKLEVEKEARITAPLDKKNLPREWDGRNIRVPHDAVATFAAFNFRVKDRSGLSSSAGDDDFPPLVVGFADKAFLPSSLPMPEEPEPGTKVNSEKHND